MPILAETYLVASEEGLLDMLPAICQEAVSIYSQTLSAGCNEAISEGLMFFYGHN